MSKARDEYVNLIFDKIERERAQRKEAHAALARAVVNPVVGKPTAAVAPPTPSASDREFEAVRVAALARIQAESDARQAEAKAVTAILAAGLSAPSGTIPLAAYATPEDLAVAAILRAGISPR